MSKVQIRGSPFRKDVSRFLAPLAIGALLFTLSACGTTGPVTIGGSPPTADHFYSGAGRSACAQPERDHF